MRFLLLKKIPILAGLDNIGATCYMNATLQCLSNIDELTNFFWINSNLMQVIIIK